MSNTKPSSLVFSVGLLLGIAIGGTTVYFAVNGDEQGTAIQQAYAIQPEPQRTVQPVVTVVEVTSEEEEDPIQKEPDEMIADSSVIAEVVLDSTLIDSLPIESSDTVEVFAENLEDSVDEVIVAFEDSFAAAEIVVREDELIMQLIHPIISVGDSTTNTYSRIDSLLAEASGVDLNEEVKELDCEFWASPINYKGYKFGKKKLLLYGINRPDSVWLYRVEDQIYLQTVEQVYELEYTDEFKSFQRVYDSRILQALQR